MEHDDNVDDILESLGGGSFEDFLGQKQQRKVKEICEPTPASQMVPTDAATTDVPVVAERLSESSSSSETPVVEGASFIPAVPDVVGRGTELEVRKHELVGSYIVEHTVEYHVDEDWRKQYMSSYEDVVTNFTLEQALERRRKLERVVFLITAEQQGVQLGIAQLCQITNAKDRASILEEDRKHRARQAKRVISKERSATAGATEKRQAHPTVSKTGKGKGHKAVDTLKNMGHDEAYVTEQVKTLGWLDEATQAYIKKSFA
jgi:hypothetical protein